MSELPTSVRAVVGLAATFVDRVRKLPQEAPELPVQLVSGAMQLSLRLQQELATLIARGDEVLGQMHDAPDDPPAWATFDDPPADAEDVSEADVILIVEDDVEPEPGSAEPAAPVPPVAKKTPTKKAPAKRAAAKKAPAKKAPAKKVPVKKAPAKKAAVKKAPAKKAAPVTQGEAAVEEALVRAMPGEAMAQSAFDRTPDPLQE